MGQEEGQGENFQEVLNRRSPDKAVIIPEATEDLAIDADPFTKNETVDTSKNVKNGKSTGYGNLDVQLFKADPEIAATILRPLFTAWWEEEKVPDD